MHAEKRKVRIRNWINQSLYEMAFFRDQLVVFAPERNNLSPRVCAGETRDTVALKPRTTDQKLRLEFAGCRFDRVNSAAVCDPPDFASKFRLPTLSAENLEVFLCDLAIIRYARGGNADAGQTTDMRFDFIYLPRGKLLRPPNRSAVRVETGFPVQLIPSRS